MTVQYELLMEASLTLTGTQQDVRLAQADLRERPEEAIERLTAAIAQLERVRHAAVYLAREQGATWDAIGQSARLSPQVAEERWSNVDFRP